MAYHAPILGRWARFDAVGGDGDDDDDDVAAVSL